MSIAADGDPCGEAGRLIWPLFNPTKREVSQSGTPLGRGGHREGAQTGIWKRGGRGMSYKLNYPRLVSVAARGQKRTLQLVTHIPNESHRLEAPIALPFAFIRTNLCKLTFPVTRGASTQSAPAKSTNLVSATAAAAFSWPPHLLPAPLFVRCVQKRVEKGTAKSVDRCEERCRAKNRCSRTTNTTRRTRSNGDETRHHPRMLSHLVIRETPALACVFSKDAADPMRPLRCTAALSEARTTLPESSSRPKPAKTAHSRNSAHASLKTAVF